MRNHVQAMILALGGLLCATAAQAQYSFDEHFTAAKAGRLGVRESAFARECGVDMRDTEVYFGEATDRNWRFEPKPALGNGVADTKTKYLGTVEMWTVRGTPRLMNVWLQILDTGSSTNELFCLDEFGRVSRQETLNVYEPIEGGPGAWIHRRKLRLFAFDRKQVLMDLFVDKQGKVTDPPKMDANTRADAKDATRPELANDILKQMTQQRTK